MAACRGSPRPRSGSQVAFPAAAAGSCVGAVMPLPPAAQAIWGQVTMEMATAMVLAPHHAHTHP